jgi:hypothetical protein
MPTIWFRQCLVFSFRPLHIDELAEVFAIGFDPEMTPDPIQGWRPENTEDAVLSACSILIAIVEVGDSPVVQILHFSVKEFFTSNQLSTISSRNVSRHHIAPDPAHKILAQARLGTLLELDEHIDKNRLEDYPLAFYAAQCWFKHAQFGDVSPSILDTMGQLFDPDRPHFLPGFGFTMCIETGEYDLLRTLLNAHRHPRTLRCIIL